MLTLSEQKNLSKLVSKDSDRLVEIFNALSDSNRCKLFRLIAKNSKINSTEASATLKISMPLVSQHFKILVSSNLLSRHKVGREVFYSVNAKDENIAAILKVID
jgi:DNA-binding transcriptional ArsR family regulator